MMGARVSERVLEGGWWSRRAERGVMSRPPDPEGRWRTRKDTGNLVCWFLKTKGWILDFGYKFKFGGLCS